MLVEVACKVSRSPVFLFSLVNECTVPTVPTVLMEVVQMMVTSTHTRVTEIISLLAEVRAYQVSLVHIIIDASCRLKCY